MHDRTLSLPKAGLRTAYISTVAAIGAVLIAWSVLGVATTAVPDPATVLLLAILAAGAQRMPVFLFRSSAVSVAFAATIAAYVLYGTHVAILVNLASAAVNAVTPKRKPFEKIAFNTGALTISALAASGTYQLLGGQVPPAQIVPTILAVAVSSLAYFAINSALTTTVISMTTDQRFTDIYRENYSWMIVNWLAAGVNGAALALAYESLHLFGALAFVMPLGVAWYSFKLYMAKSKELRRRNDELETLNRTLEMRTLRLEGSQLSVIGALVGALEAKDKYTKGHASATMTHAVAIARKLRLPDDDVNAIQLGALFHDIGKVGLPEGLLCKPGTLTPVEWTEMRAHPVIGANLIGHVPELDAVRPIVEAHHERVDGGGYPHGLKGNAIPIGARIVSVADAFHAMTAPRAHRPAMSRAAALAELRRSSGTQFDPAVVEAFIGLLAEEARSAEPVAQRVVVEPAAEAVVVHQHLN